MAGLTLFELDERIRELIESGTDEHGVLSDEADHALDELFEKREQKLLAYGAVIKELRAESKAVKDEAQRMRQRAQAIENRAERLKERLADALGPGNTLKDARCSIYWTPATRVVVDDEDKLPDGLVKIERTPRLSDIKKLLSEGPASQLKEVAHLETRKVLGIR